MSQIICQSITLTHGHQPLVKDASFTIKKGEKVCIIGRNGAGKSTLMHVLMGENDLEQGSIDRDDGLTLAMLGQTVPSDITGRVFDIIQSSLNDLNIEVWDQQHRVEKVLTRLQLDGEQEFSRLSGGLKRRVLLAKALVTEPDVLLLDEPTNHLDIDAIIWLEQFLASYRSTVIFITHDRMLTEKIATHIVEIDNGCLTSWHGHYSDFLRHKEYLLNAEQKENALFDKKLAQEEVWIRQGIKARRTRNEGRVRALKKMREERSNRRVRPGDVSLKQHDISLSGKVVFDVEDISYQYQQHQAIIKNFSSVIMRGDKIGIIGPNGSGKSTLLNLLLDKLQPTSGSIKHGTKLNIAYFDQQQSELEDDKSVQMNVSPGTDQVTINGQSKHIMSYLQDFLFSPERARSAVKYLSGGERNRVMLAKLFLRPCNVLVLDEPTNDLDVETLELLEEQLSHFSGTLLLVSHDREFLNNVVTSTIVMEGHGQVTEYIGGYDDWLRQRPKMVTPQKTEPKDTQTEKAKPKLSIEERRELNKLPNKIEKLETKLTELHARLSDPDFYQSSPDKIATVQNQVKELEQQIQQCYSRWEALEALK